MNILIFTKDRPMQLHLLLTSMVDHFPGNHDIHVLGKVTNYNYGKGYAIFRKVWRGVNWNYEEGDFHDCVLKIIDEFTDSFTLCFTDDDVVINKISQDELVHGLDILQKHPEVNAVSLRMYPKLDYCYAKDVFMIKPDFGQLHGMNIWQWNDQKPDIDWGYPMSLAGNIYRHEDIEEIWRTQPIKSPNLIEWYMHVNRPQESRPFQVCYNEQKVYNVANNLVQTVCSNRFDKKPWHDPNIINDWWLKGKKLDKFKIYNKIYNQANGPADFEFI